MVFAARRFLTALADPVAPADRVLDNCGIVQLTYENGVFSVEQIVNPN